MIELDNIAYNYGGGELLSDVSLSLQPGSFHFLTGPSGAGKTTLLKLCYGALFATQGQVIAFGSALEPEGRDQTAQARRRIGVVDQDCQFLDHLTVAENVALPLTVTGRHDLLGNLETLLRWVGLGKVAGQLPPSLSGGERQTVAIARAVYFGAKVLILDEPTSALGVRQTSNVLATVDKVRKNGIGVVFITHNVRHAMAVGDRFTVLNRGQTLGTAQRGQITPEELQDMMAGGQEMVALEGSLGGTV